LHLLKLIALYHIYFLFQVFFKKNKSASRILQKQINQLYFRSRTGFSVNRLCYR
jgi:hypothetical protein